jgi:hypothetical protein
VTGASRFLIGLVTCLATLDGIPTVARAASRRWVQGGIPTSSVKRLLKVPATSIFRPADPEVDCVIDKRIKLRIYVIPRSPGTLESLQDLRRGPLRPTRSAATAAAPYFSGAGGCPRWLIRI